MAQEIIIRLGGRGNKTFAKKQFSKPTYPDNTSLSRSALQGESLYSARDVPKVQPFGKSIFDVDMNAELRRTMPQFKASASAAISKFKAFRAENIRKRKEKQLLKQKMALARVPKMEFEKREGLDAIRKIDFGV